MSYYSDLKKLIEQNKNEPRLQMVSKILEAYKQDTNNRNNIAFCIFENAGSGTSLENILQKSAQERANHKTLSIIQIESYFVALQALIAYMINDPTWKGGDLRKHENILPHLALLKLYTETGKEMYKDFEQANKGKWNETQLAQFQQSKQKTLSVFNQFQDFKRADPAKTDQRKDPLLRH